MLRSLSFSLLLIIAAALQGVFSFVAQAQDKSRQYEQSIGEIGEKIKNISRNLNANKELVATERDKLLEAEQSLHKLSQSLQKTEYSLAKNQHESDALDLRMAKLLRSQASNKEALRRLLKSRYYRGEPDFLKSLLNQENPYAVGRLTNYHGYFSTALKNRFSALSRQAIEFKALKAVQSGTHRRLTEEREKQKKLELDYKKQKQSRAKVIAKLDKKIATNAQILEKLKNDRSRLKTLLTQLKKQAAELKRLDQLKAQQEAQEAKEHERQSTKPESAQDIKPVKRAAVKGGFLKQKGRLAYPVTGKLIRRFGSRLPASGMRSEGTFFNTQGSVSVKSIFRGRVLFADFLKGYGLLIIVDHGDDHISLYGHNDRLLKKVGDKVDSNEVIAKSGVTGGLKSHGLYFEIRKNATPIDASKWCR